MRARRFTEAGITRFQELATTARALNKAGTPVPEVPAELLWDEAFSTSMDYELPDADPVFADKLEVGLFCCRLIPEGDHEVIRTDAPFWSWLAARYFDQITKGRTKIKEPRAYVAAIGFQEFYRHLLLGPYYVYFMAREDPERVRVLLYDEPTTMNEVMVQLGSYQTLLQNPSLQEVVRRLYFDEKRHRIKRGAGGKENGAPRRLMDFVRQIELNYDLASIEAPRLWSMLPKEFEPYKRGQTL